jgi:hypothetical protein
MDEDIPIGWKPESEVKSEDKLANETDQHSSINSDLLYYGVEQECHLETQTISNESPNFSLGEAIQNGTDHQPVMAGGLLNSGLEHERQLAVSTVQ